MTQTTKAILAVITAGCVLMLALVLLSQRAHAADLGSQGCCSDLEERIAELEAISAKKGNRKVTLTVYGQVNAGLLYLDVNPPTGYEGYDRTSVTQNGTDETFVGFRGVGRISPDVTAGYTLEIAVHQTDSYGESKKGIGYASDGNGSVDLSVRQSFVYLRSESLGTVAIGKTAQATNDFDKMTTANTAVATKPLSLQPLADTYLYGYDLSFDGDYKNIVRYSTPTVGGFVASASWGAQNDYTKDDGNGQTIDAALRYAGEFGGFQVVGGVGFRRDTQVNVGPFYAAYGDSDTKLAVASVKHVLSGIFVTANYADSDYKESYFEAKGWNLQAGWEHKIWSIGATTVYGEYENLSAQADDKYYLDVDVDVFGAGIVQAVDAAALDLYLAYKRYEIDDKTYGYKESTDVQSVIAGGRIRF